MRISNIILETFFEDINNEDILSIWKIYLAIATVILFAFIVFGSFFLGYNLLRSSVLLGIFFILISFILLVYYIYKFFKTMIKLSK